MSVEADGSALLRMFQNKATRNEGFKMILNRYSRDIYYFLRKMDLNHEDADELLQDVFVEFWKTGINNEHNYTVKITLYSLATTYCLDYLTKHAAVHLRGLTSRQLLVMILKDREEFDFGDIAQIASIPVNEVRGLFKTSMSTNQSKNRS